MAERSSWGMARLSCRSGRLPWAMRWTGHAIGGGWFGWLGWFPVRGVIRAVMRAVMRAVIFLGAIRAVRGAVMMDAIHVAPAVCMALMLATFILAEKMDIFITMTAPGIALPANTRFGR